MKTRLLQIFDEVCKEHDWKIHEAEIMPDHVHLFIEGTSTACVSEIVNRLKGRSSFLLRKEFKPLRTRIPTLWTRSYYAGTVGNVSEAVVKRYIKNQTNK